MRPRSRPVYSGATGPRHQRQPNVIGPCVRVCDEAMTGPVCLKEAERLMTRIAMRRGLRQGARSALLVAAAIGLMSGVARAQAGDPPPDPRAAQPERPTVATHAFTIAPGIVELETGMQQQHPEPGLNQVAVPIVLKIGLAPRVQLGLVPGWQRTSADGTGQAGLTDLGVALKVRLTDASTPVLGAFAVQPGFTVATGSVEKGTGTGSASASLLLISSHNVSGVAIDLNLGYTRRGGDGTTAPKNATAWTVSTGWPIAGPVGLVAEVFGNLRTTGEAGGPASVAFLVGPTFTVRKELVLDAGAILDIRHYGGRAVYAGVTWNMGRVWAPGAKSPQK
jgi:hypothetical protein